MGAPKGQPKPKGAGRPPGGLNKVTLELKGLILGALSDVGGQKYLARQAEANPPAFLALIGKILPRDVLTEISGPGSGPIKLIIERVIVDNDETENTDS